MIDEEFRRRTLEYVCARRASLTVANVAAGAILIGSLLLYFVADISRGSSLVALADAGIASVLFGATAFVLRRCNRLQRED